MQRRLWLLNITILFMFKWDNSKCTPAGKSLALFVGTKLWWILRKAALNKQNLPCYQGDMLLPVKQSCVPLGALPFPVSLLCVKCGARVTGNILTMWFLWHISLRGLWKKMLPQKVHFQSKRCQFEEHSVNFQWMRHLMHDYSENKTPLSRFEGSNSGSTFF